MQIGDPITQKRMFDFLIRARDKGLYRFITDNGAGGLSSSIGEMAGECGGCRMDLAKAPLKYPGLNPWEILISEAQERMSLAVPPEQIEEFLAMALRFGVEATVLGEFTDNGVFHMLYGEQTVAWLPMEFMHEGLPPMQLPAKWTPPHNQEPQLEIKENYSDDLKQLLSALNICSKESVVRRYDHEVQGGSVVKPFCGITNDGPSDAAIVRPILDSFEGVVTAHGICPRYSDIDTYHMTANAVDEALRNYVAVGGSLELVAGLDNFCWCDPVLSEKTPDGPYKMAQLVRSNQALYDVCMAYNLPLISGKDSMKNDFYDGTTKISIPRRCFSRLSARSMMPGRRSRWMSSDRAISYICSAKRQTNLAAPNIWRSPEQSATRYPRLIPPRRTNAIRPITKRPHRGLLRPVMTSPTAVWR